MLVAELTAALGGLARLAFEARDGRTRLMHSETRTPLGVMRTLYLDDALPDMAFLYLTNPTAGILSGDVESIDVRVGVGAKAHVTSQAATKVYAMPAGRARVETRLEVHSGGMLEYLPDPIIPFKGSRFEQATEIVVHPGGLLVYGQVLAPGRIAMGESLEYSEFRSRLTVRTPDGVPLFHESYTIDPAERSPLGLGVFGHRVSPAFGMLIVAQPSGWDTSMLDKLLACEATLPFGVSALPYHAGAVVTSLGDDATEARAALVRAWAIARKLLLNAELPRLGKY